MPNFNELSSPLRLTPHTSAYLSSQLAGPSEGILPHADKKGNSSAEPSTEGKASDFDTTHEAVLTSGMSSYPPHNHSGTVSRGLSEEQDALLTEIQRRVWYRRNRK